MIKVSEWKVQLISAKVEEPPGRDSLVLMRGGKCCLSSEQNVARLREPGYVGSSLLFVPGYVSRSCFDYLGGLGLVGWQCFVGDPKELGLIIVEEHLEKCLGLAPMSPLLRHRGRGPPRANSLN